MRTNVSLIGIIFGYQLINGIGTCALSGSLTNGRTCSEIIEGLKINPTAKKPKKSTLNTARSVAVFEVLATKFFR